MGFGIWLLGFAAQPLSPAHAEPLRSNTITAVCVDKNHALFGTIKGLYAMPLPQSGGSTPANGAAGMIPGFDGVVTSIVAARGKIFVGTTDGVLLLDGNKFESLPIPARGGSMSSMSGTDSSGSIVLLAACESGAPSNLASVFMGGDFGLARIENNNAITYLPTPAGSSSITAMASSGPDLLLSFEGSVYLFKTLTEQWVRIASGTTYSTLCLLGSQNRLVNSWFGLRSDGGIDAGTISPQHLFSNQALPLSHDPATAITVIENSKSEATLFIGTMRGTILSGTIYGFGQSSLHPGDIDFSVVRMGKSVRPIRTLLSPGLPGDAAELIYAGTDGGGILEIDRSSGTVVEKTILSNEPIAFSPDAIMSLPDASQEERHATIGKLARALQFARRYLPLDRLKIIAWGIGVVGVLLLIGKLLSLRSSDQETQIKVWRRANASPIDLPKLSELSLDLAAHARRFQDVTSEINELSRRVVSGESGDMAERARQVTIAFEEIDTWMRSRLADLRKQREDKIAQLARLRTRAREQQSDTANSPPEGSQTSASGNPDNSDHAELDGIERWLEAVDRDEKYLKYVLEE